MPDFGSLLKQLQSKDLEEVPVSVEEFVTSKEYLGLPPLSDYQYRVIKAGTQIYDEGTLIEAYGAEEGRKRYWQTFNEIIMVLGKGCHAPYTPVYDASLGKWKRLDEFTEDSQVMAYDGEKLAAKYATEAFREGYGRMLRVKTGLGLSEDVYEGHKYLVWKQNQFFKRNERKVRGPEWTEVKDIAPGDRIAVAMGFDVAEPKNIPVEHARLLGYLIGDGMCPSDSNPTINVDFGADESESLTRYLADVETIGHGDSKVAVAVKHKTKKMFYVRHGRYSSIVKLAKDYGLWGKRANDKSIPDAVWASDNSVLAEFMSALWSTDGCVYIKKNKGNGWVSNQPAAEYCTISEQLGYDVLHALMRLGVSASIRSRVPKYMYKGEKREGQRAYYITVNGCDSFTAFADKITLLDYKQRNIVTGLEIMDGYRSKKTFVENGVFWTQVKSIEDIGDGEFWTLTEPDLHNYTGSGIISLNSGKDYLSTIICAYVVYLLLCLKDPQDYFGKPPGDMIDIMNIAINAKQAYNVFFRGFTTRIQRCPWFEGKYTLREGERTIEFDKNVRMISGHSESESLEGYNVLMVVLDEISGFGGEGSDKRITAESTYKMHRASVTSRFGRRGKLLLLSFPRHKQDFIMTRYNDVIGTKFVVKREYTFKLNPALPDGDSDNEFTIEWDEDNIETYKIPGAFALKRPSWEINPTKDIEDYTLDFFTDPQDALTRFACMPSEAQYGFFRDHDKVDKALVGVNGVDENGAFRDDFLPDPDKTYYIHVDLALKHDKCAVTMSHVEDWERIRVGEQVSEALPKVVVDAIMWWTPTSDRTVDFVEVREYIVSLRARGFKIGLITFDRWRSETLIEYFNEAGMKAELLSVARQHYDDLQMLVSAGRLVAPQLKDLRDELLALRIMPNGKVDHPRSGHNDLSDSMTGSVFNAATHTHRPVDEEAIQVITPADLKPKVSAPVMNTGIKPPSRKMPDDIRDYLELMVI